MDSMLIYTRNLIASRKKLLELMNEFNKVEGDRVGTEVSISVPDNSNERSEIEMKKMPFPVVSKI